MPNQFTKYVSEPKREVMMQHGDVCRIVLGLRTADPAFLSLLFQGDNNNLASSGCLTSAILPSTRLKLTKARAPSLVAA